MMKAYNLCKQRQSRTLRQNNPKMDDLSYDDRKACYHVKGQEA